MATTVEPPAPVEASTSDVLDRADGVELLGGLDGSGYKSGAALVRRADGQMVQLGPLMYALLEEVDGRRTNAELATALCHRLGRACDEEHVVALAQKLAAQGLLAGHEHNAPPRSNPLLALRWKVLVTNPRTTRLLTAPFTVLFRPWLLWPVVATFLVVCWYVLFQKGVASAVASSFHRPELMLLVVGLGVASAGFHELGHAAACRYGGATPSGMGMGIYMVWPAFYTDVTDSYRLPRRDRLRVDLGGVYFNAVVAVATLGVWLLWREDALLLLVALQLLMIVKNLSPVIRSDGYHILADATGVPDLYAHLGPTLRRLIPGRRREPSALKGWARALVTVWVLVIVPVLLSMLLGAVLILPRLLTSTWESGRHLVTSLPHDGLAGGTADAVRLVALVLPLLGSALVVQRLAWLTGGKALAWSEGSAARRGVVAVAATAALCGTAWAMWPAGQYQPVRASDRGTLVSFRTAVTSPASVARPAPAAAAPVRLSPGTHLAVSMIPVGGATKRHPALFVIQGDDGKPAVAILSTSAPDTASAPTTTDPAATTPTTTTTETTTTTATTTTAPAPAGATQPVVATAFRFELPKQPGPGGTQALAVNTADGAVRYDVAYALVTVKDGAPVTNTNSAFALASCNRCTTVAVSFQVVLIVGRSALIAPIDAAGALNVNCPACVTTAIADQMVITLKSQPTEQLVTQIQAALKQLDALPSLGAGGTPAAVAATVATVQKEIETALADSGLVANPPTTSTTTTTASTTTRATTTTTPATTTTSTQSTTTVAAQTTPATTTTSPSTTTTPAATTTSSTTTTATTTTSPTTTSTTTTTTPAETTTTTAG